MFVEWNGRHHYRQVVKDPGGFKAELLRRLNMTEAEYQSYIDEMKDYRDKFVAHLDDEREMRPPNLDAAKIAVQLYHEQIVREANPAILGNLVATARRMSTAFDNESAMAASIYARIEQTVPPGRRAG